jgi:hypothetical protein
MKILALFRIFVLFPLFGILIPDITVVLKEPTFKIPFFHVAICVGLLLLIISSFVLQNYISSQHRE